MELDTLKSMWQEREARMEQSARLNTILLDKIESRKVQSFMRPLLIQNKIVLSLHIVFIAALIWFFLYHISELPYAASALVLILYYSYLTANCLRQINAIWKVGRHTDIVGKQSALAELNTSILHFSRISLLSIPFFLSFPVVVLRAMIDLKLDYFDNLDIIAHTQGKWWTVEIIVCILFIPAGTWFYHQVKPSNIHKAWVQHIIRRTSNGNAYKAARFLDELQQLKKEN